MHVNIEVCSGGMFIQNIFDNAIVHLLHYKNAQSSGTWAKENCAGVCINIHQGVDGWIESATKQVEPLKSHRKDKQYMYIDELQSTWRQ